MKIRWFLLILFVGCKAVSGLEVGQINSSELENAKIAFAAGELYRAKKMTAQVLDQNPTNKEAEDLMAEILGAEVARQKELYDEKVVEEWTRDEKEVEVRNWLERSRLLLEVKHYEQALNAAEKVFLYDPENLQASRLIDEINQKAIADGKSASLIHSKIMQEEVDIRINRYRNKARISIDSGRFGEAKLLIQKILLLKPEDPVALRLREEIGVRSQELKV